MQLSFLHYWSQDTILEGFKKKCVFSLASCRTVLWINHHSSVGYVKTKAWQSWVGWFFQENVAKSGAPTKLPSWHNRGKIRQSSGTSSGSICIILVAASFAVRTCPLISGSDWCGRVNLLQRSNFYNSTISTILQFLFYNKNIHLFFHSVNHLLRIHLVW